MTSSPPRVSFSEGSARPSFDKKDDVSPSNSRANSVSRRASLPVPRVSVSEKLLATSAGAPNDAPLTLEKSSSLRRSSVSTGMMSAPFEKGQKEAPRWRPYTFEAQQQKPDSGSGEAANGIPVDQDDANKPLNQRVMEKSAGSLVLGFFVVAIAFAVGSVSRLIIGRDVGLFGFYLNQIILVAIFCIDRRKDSSGALTDAKRMDNFNGFEILTLVCQVLPILYTWRAGNALTYSGISLLILVQVIFKALLMVGLGDIVEIAL
jgi:hypothetical protein